MTALMIVGLAVMAAALWPGAGLLAVRTSLHDQRQGHGQRESHVRRRGKLRRPPGATPGEVADALALLALALRAGIGQEEALARVADGSSGAVRTSLRSVTAALRWGRPPAEAWGYAPAVWQGAALAWQVAATAGAPPADLVEGASQRLREEESRRVERAIATTGVLLVLPLGLAFLPAFACTAVVPVVLALTRSVLG